MEMIATFYVNGTSIGGSDMVHSTPWETIDDAFEACETYRAALNTWWAAMHPGDLYCDETCTMADTLHLDGDGNSIRYGIIPDVADHPPAPQTGAVLLPWTDGTDWFSF